MSWKTLAERVMNKVNKKQCGCGEPITANSSCYPNIMDDMVVTLKKIRKLVGEENYITVELKLLQHGPQPDGTTAPFTTRWTIYDEKVGLIYNDTLEGAFKEFEKKFQNIRSNSF